MITICSSCGKAEDNTPHDDCRAPSNHQRAWLGHALTSEDMALLSFEEREAAARNMVWTDARWANLLVEERRKIAALTAEVAGLRYALAMAENAEEIQAQEVERLSSYCSECGARPSAIGETFHEDSCSKKPSVS